MATIGENIKRIRKEKGLTQKQLGASCKPPMADSAIRRYEAGAANPKLATVRKIAEALDCKLYELIDDWTKVSPEEWAEDMASTANKAIKLFEKTEPLEKQKNLFQKFQKLNEKGQDKAIEQIELLTKIPEYRRNNVEDNSPNNKQT